MSKRIFCEDKPSSAHARKLKSKKLLKQKLRIQTMSAVENKFRGILKNDICKN